MKLVGSLMVASSLALFESDVVSRVTTGEWIEQFMTSRDPKTRAAVQGEKGFRPLAAMMLYMTGFGKDTKDPELKKNFDKKLEKLEKTYTNYGCYCWIGGTEKGVIGGGAAEDVTDFHCKELYRCYKCVHLDYNKNYTDVSYQVDFKVDGDGNRLLDCSANSKQDAGNICECDKRFAENIAKTEETCERDPDAKSENGKKFCLDKKKLRTENGGGNFNPNKMCDKDHKGQDRDKCCGIYPNRYPYDMNFDECCKTTAFDGDGEQFEVFGLTRNVGTCNEVGGTVVVSSSDDPHKYVNL